MEWIKFIQGDELPNEPIEIRMTSGNEIYLVHPLRDDNWWYPYIREYRLMGGTTKPKFKPGDFVRHVNAEESIPAIGIVLSVRDGVYYTRWMWWENNRVVEYDCEYPESVLVGVPNGNDT